MITNSYIEFTHNDVDYYINPIHIVTIKSFHSSHNSRYVVELITINNSYNYRFDHDGLEQKIDAKKKCDNFLKILKKK
jgi:hypothetical protein